MKFLVCSFLIFFFWLKLQAKLLTHPSHPHSLNSGAWVGVTSNFKPNAFWGQCFVGKQAMQMLLGMLMLCRQSMIIIYCKIIKRTLFGQLCAID
jgi:hypothetical protein